MKKYIVVLLILPSLLAFSQKSHVALNMGPAFPLGNFSNTKDYLSNGYATTGFNLSFEGNYIPTWYFGIGGSLSFATNYPNQDSMFTGLFNELKKMNVPAIPGVVETDFTSGNWSYVNFLVGPTFAYPAGQLQFNLKAYIGLSIVMPPNHTLYLKYNDNEITSNSEPQNLKFCYNLGADIIYKLAGNYSLKFGVDYFHTSTEYDVEFILDENTKLPLVKRSMDINSIHASVGIAVLI